MKRRPKSQPRIPGIVRESRSTGLLPKIDDKVNALAVRYDVSPSWVRATLLAAALGVDEEEQPDFRKKAK